MKVKIRSIIVATLILILFTVLPLASPMLIPQEFFNAFSIQAGIDFASLLNKVAMIGLAMGILVLLRGIVEKNSQAGLTLSIINKVFWFIIVLFIIGMGNIERFGLVVLGGSSGDNGATNIVTLDLRLIVYLVAIIITIMIVQSIFEYQESKHTPEPLNITHPRENSGNN